MLFSRFKIHSLFIRAATTLEAINSSARIHQKTKIVNSCGFFQFMNNQSRKTACASGAAGTCPFRAGTIAPGQRGIRLSSNQTNQTSCVVNRRL